MSKKDQDQSPEAVINALFDGMDLTAVERDGGQPSSDQTQSSADDNVEPSRESGGSNGDDYKRGEKSTDESTLAKGESVPDQPQTDWEKRFKDTQRSFNDEHQRRLQLEQELQQYRNAQAAGATTQKQDENVEQVFADLSKEFEEDPDKAFANALKLMQQQNARFSKEIESVRQQDARRTSQAIEQQEVAAKKRHDDYETFVDDDFVQELQASPELIRQWETETIDLGGDRAEAAYKVAQRHKAYKEFIKTGKMPDYIAAKQSTNAPPAVKTLSDVASAPPPKRSGKGLVFNDIGDIEGHLFSGLL